MWFDEYVVFILESGGESSREFDEAALGRTHPVFRSSSRLGVPLRALYHRFLCDAEVGLTVDGAILDELGASDDWCDMGRLGMDCGGWSRCFEVMFVSVLNRRRLGVAGLYRGLL
ncbi:hypothetical protein Droror1_Dr00009350 [Drosera rotundifolia]